MCTCVCTAKLVETGTFAGDEDDDVLFDDMVDDYEDEDEAIDAVSVTITPSHYNLISVCPPPPTNPINPVRVRSGYTAKLQLLITQD